jgi:alkylresorcinol/alkylpyrone synthase
MKITGASSAFPEHYYPQEALIQRLAEHWGAKLPNPAVLRRFHDVVGVDGRYLALPIERYEPIANWGEANNLWIECAQDLGGKALLGALAEAQLEPKELDAIYFVSVTGVASPSIDARLVNSLGLSTRIKRVPIFGLGCVAGAAGISRAADYVRGFRDQHAALVAVELCSLTLQREDLSIANLIASGLFGDGAAAVIVSGPDTPQKGPEILDTRSVFYPDTEEVMGWDITHQGFKIVLSRDVPLMVETNLAGDVDAFLGDHGLKRSDIDRWILHTGGPKVLKATEQALELAPGALDVSWKCLRRTGNLSSASVLVVLEEVMKNARPPAGSMSLLAAMGPAFCSELVLLRW